MSAPADLMAEELEKPEPTVGPQPLDEDALRSVLEYEVRQSLGEEHDRVAERQRLADAYYRGDLFGNEVEGRSTFVERTLAETIEWIEPVLMRRLTENQNLALYTDTTEEGIAAGIGARMTTGFNHYFRENLNGFQLLLEWTKAGMLYVHAPVKGWAERVREPLFERLEGLTEPELEALLQDRNIEPIQLSSRMEEVPAPVSTPGGVVPITMQVPVYDVRIKRWREFPRIRVEGIPPEEFLISADARSIEDTPWVGHRRLVTKGALASMGIGWDVLEDLPRETSVSWDTRKEIREQDLRSSAWNPAGNREDLASQTVCITEGLLRVDADGDGFAETLHILAAGRTQLRILRSDYADDSMFFALFCAIPMPYRISGEGFGDLVSDIQLLKSTLTRMRLDNIYLHNYPRHVLLEDQVDLDSYLNVEPGAPVIAESTDAVAQLPVSALPPWAQEMTAELEATRENRTGVPRYSDQRFNAAQNETATAFSQIAEAANAKIDLLLRIFSEGGLKRLFQRLPKMLRAATTEATEFRIGEEWVTFDPREWPENPQVTVQVGISPGQAEAAIARENMLLERKIQAMSMGWGGYITDPQRIYNSCVRLSQLAGRANPGQDWINPQGQPPPEPPPNPESIKIQSEAEQGAAKVRIDAERLAAETAEKTERLRISDYEARANDERERMRIEMERQVRTYEVDKRFEAQMAQVAAQKTIAKEKGDGSGAGDPGSSA